MRTLKHGEDLELQIKLAQLQADVQIYLTMCFGFIAVLVAFIIGFMQTFYILPSDQDFVKNELFALILVLNTIMILLTYYYIKKAKAARAEMKKLEERYAW